MDHLIFPGRQPTAPIEFMTHAKRLAFMLNFVDGGWQSTRFALLKVMEERLEGMFEVLLGNESKFTDTRAEFVIYVEEHELLKAQAIVDYLTAQEGGAAK